MTTSELLDYPALLKKIMSEGSIVNPRGSECRELMHARLAVKNPIYHWPSRPLDKILGYWRKEWAWYMSGDREDSCSIARYARMWQDIMNEDGSLNSNYGYLVFYHQTPHPSMGEITMTPFAWAKRSLQLDKDSRRAIITYNNGGYNFIDNLDYICTQHQAFYIRNNKLLCYVALRSSDAIFGLPYNMPWWVFVAQQLRLELLPWYPELELAPVEVDIYSAHIYKRHYNLVETMLSEEHKEESFESVSVPLDYPMAYYDESFKTLVGMK